MKASAFVAHYLEARGITHVFELVGGMITHLLDSIRDSSQIAIVSCHHEQAAAFAAEGHARISGIPGIALATSGPGATNLLTAIGSCYFDSIPAVFITGQVNTHELKGTRGVRQLGFQETDIVSMAEPICKSAVQVQRAADLPQVLEEAFRLALDGRQGPCLVDLPMNVQAELIDDAQAGEALHLARQDASQDHSEPSQQLQPEAAEEPLRKDFIALLKAIDQAERPLLLMGGGCAATTNREAARQIVDLLAVPVVHSLMGVDILPESHPCRIGFIGSYGNRWANKALGAADLLIVFGSRLDIRQTGSDVKSFCEGKQIWQIDIDKAEIGLRVQSQYQLCCSIDAAAMQLSLLVSSERMSHDAWFGQIHDLRDQYPAAREYVVEPGEVNPIELLQALSKLAPNHCNYVTDVGQHQMWAAQSLAFSLGDRFLTSGGMGAMGFGLPAAIGAAFADREAMTILISGDGSFQLNIQELETLRRNHLNLKIALFNNHCHGMVRQFQESYFHGKLQSTVEGYSAPEFVAVCKAYGIPAFRLEAGAALEDALNWLLQTKGPSLLEVPLSIQSKVYPKLAFGRRFGEMEPEAKPIAMEST
jgi:acetolactate synthase I/II/III large subunit